MQSSPGVEEDGQDGSFIERARRTQIIDATIVLISAEGVARASLARIAAVASISPALINYYFGSRDGLLREVLRVADARMDSSMSDGPEEPTSYADGLRRIVIGYVERCAKHPAEVIAAQAIRESISREEQEARERDEGGGAAELVGFLVEGQEHGEFRRFDPWVFAGALFAAISAIPGQLRDRSSKDALALGEELASIFVRAAARHDGEGGIELSTGEVDQP